MSVTSIVHSSASHHLPSPLILFRHLWRAGSQFRDYNFREYAHRNVREKFRAHQHETNPDAIRALLERGAKDLKMLQRQSLINQLYSSGETVIEKQLASAGRLPSSFTVKTSQAFPREFQSWLTEAQIGSKAVASEAPAIEAEISPSEHKYDEQKTPTKAGPMPEN